MAEIKYIPVKKLWQHPDNPRKDLGDVTELAESIKVNGVLQNLTVVPLIGEITKKWDGESYRVIIGHRRLAAAKLAGLEELPCVVVEMSEREQLSTMLTENMQRSDLTVYEQAQGFQMMLDMGDTVEDIAEKSGFSTTTVRRRVKLLDLDKEKFKKAEARGATLDDYIELDKLEDPDVKNKILDYIGTANFKNELKKALDEQKTKERMAKWLEVIKTFATEKEDCGYATHKYVCNYGYWNKSTEVTIPEDADTVAYYYKVSERQIDIFRDRDTEQEDKDKAEREERQRIEEQVRGEFEDIRENHFWLRSEFVKNLSNATCKKHLTEIASYAARVMWEMSRMAYSSFKVDTELLGSCLDVKIPKETLRDGSVSLAEIAGIESASESMPEKLMFCLAYSAADGAENGYYLSVWENGRYVFRHMNNVMLTGLYELLETLGYEMSDEEASMMAGTAEIFEKYGGD